MNYKLRHPLEKRTEEAKRILDKYPDRIPVIVEKAKNVTDTFPDIDKNKFLVPIDLEWNQFVWIIRKRIKLSPDQAIYIFVNNALPANNASLKSVYDEYKEPCGFLYCEYAAESTFGEI